MDADAIAEFNTTKCALTRALHAATIEFEAQPGRTYPVGFGDARVEGALHESGQGLDELRSGWLFFPRQPDFTPALLATFRVLTAERTPALVGTRWQVGSLATASLEPDLKFECRRLTA